MPRLNVEAYVIDFLAREMPDVTVRARVPDPRPKSLVVVRRGGGGMVNRLQDRAGVHLSVYGGSEWETSELAERVSDALLGLNYDDQAFLDGIARVDEESLRSDPDTQTDPDTPRWFGSYTFTTHAY